MHRDDAIALVCGPLCLQLDGVLPKIMRPVSIVSGDAHHGSLMTWLARGARFLTLIQTARGTRVYDHADDLLYYAGPDAHLSQACPEGHAFLCQAVCDKTEAGPVPRLLVMDLVAPAIQCPHERNETLRRVGSANLPHICHIQWAGERQALQAFVDSGGVPHDVETLVALSAPLELVKPSGSGISALDSVLSQMHP